MTTPLGAMFNSLGIQLSTIIDKQFPDKCSITRPPTASTVSAYGTIPTASYSTVHSNVGCSWGPAGKDAKEHIRALQIKGVTVYAVTLPSIVSGAAIDVKPKDRIVIASRGAEPERTFEVMGPPIRNAGLSLFVLCTLEEQ